MFRFKVGIFGGTGWNDPDILKNPVERVIQTPFGKPSDAVVEGCIEGVPCAIISRHGRNHSILPSQVNYRANIWALKLVGCTHILASTACGGLQDYTIPGDFLLLDQFYDRTNGRKSSFYGGGPDDMEGVVHMTMATMADPFCEETRKIIIEAAHAVSMTVCDRSKGTPTAHPCFHTHASVVTIDGPRFSTRFESQLHRSWGADLVGMTQVPEVVLAAEAGLSYASVAIVTDYDSWHAEHPDVSIEVVLTEFAKNVEKLKKLFVQAIALMAKKDWTEVIKANQKRIQDARMDLVRSNIPVTG